MGVAEVAELLGISRVRLWQLRNAPEFPDPKWNLQSGPLWETSDVIEYSETRAPWAGRRRRYISVDEDPE